MYAVSHLLVAAKLLCFSDLLNEFEILKNMALSGDTTAQLNGFGMSECLASSFSAFLYKACLIGYVTRISRLRGSNLKTGYE